MALTESRARSQLWPIAAITFIAALLLFVVTIVIGILNGLDLYEPDHDTLITHVHAGTLGWISLAAGGTALLMFSRGRELAERDVAHGTALGWSLIAGIGLYVAASSLVTASPVIGSNARSSGRSCSSS